MTVLSSRQDAGEDRSTELLAVLWTFTTLAMTIVLFKLYTRFKIIHQTGLDDVLILFSAMLVITCTVLFTVDVHYGMGRHTHELTYDDAVKAVKINYIANPFGIMAYSIPNIAVAIFIDRILPLNSWKRVLLYTLAISQNLIAAVSCVLLFVQCTPAESLWNPYVPPTSCLSFALLTRYSYFVGAYTAFTDVVLAVVPIMAFRKLQMPRKAKIATSIIMSMTLIAAICAIVKTSKLYQLTDLQDFTYGTVDLIITAVVEANMIIIAACIPSLRPFVLAIGQSIGQSTTLRKLRGSGSNLVTTEESSGNGWFKLSSIGNQPSTYSATSGSNGSHNMPSSNEDISEAIVKTTTFSVAAVQG